MIGNTLTKLRRRRIDNPTKRRILTPRVEWLERRQVLATIAFASDSLDQLTAVASQATFDGQFGDQLTSYTEDTASIANLNQLGTQTVTPSESSATETITYTKNSSSFEISASSYIPTHLVTIAPEFPPFNEPNGDFELGLEEPSPDPRGGYVLEFDILPDVASTIQLVNVTVTGSFSYDDLNLPEQQSNLTLTTEGGGVLRGGIDIDTTNPFQASKLSSTVEVATDTTFYVDLSPLVATYQNEAHSAINNDFLDGLESTLSLNVSLSTVSTVKPIQVAAEYNQAGSEPANSFGPYVQGIPLPNNFTITMGSYLPSVPLDVEYQFYDSATPQTTYGESVTATANGTNQWVFQQDVGNLEPIDTLEITVYADDVEIASASYPVNLIATLTGSLQASASGNLVDASKLRFIGGISAPTTFTETLSNLPSFYDGLLTSVEVDQLNSSGDPSYVPYKVTATPVIGGGASFSFTIDPGKVLADTPVTTSNGSQSPLYDSFILPAFSNGADNEGPTPIFNLSFSAVQLLGLPDWIDSSSINSEIWNGSQYVINFDFPGGLEDDFFTRGTPFGLFDDLYTDYAAGINVTVTANLTYASGNDAQATANDLFVTATFLDQPVLNLVTTPSSAVILSAPLDPLSLEPTNGITIIVPPINLVPTNNVLFDIPFGLPTPSGTVPFQLPLAGLAGTLGLSGDFRAIVQYVTASMKVTLNYNDDDLTFGNNPDGTASYVQFDASASARLDFNIHGGVSFFTIFNIASADLNAAVAANVSTRLHVDITGDFSSPELDLDNGLSYAGVAVAAGFNGDVTFLGTSANAPSTVDLTKDDIVKETGLFGLPEPPDYSFNIAGIGNVNSPSIPGVPSNSTTPVITAGPAPAIAPALALNGQGKPPTSTLTADTVVFGPIDSVQFDLNVLANQAALTSGHHYLDTVLLGADGSEVILQSQDLSMLPLQTNANPLGYSSGWTPVTLDLSNTNLELAEPYQLAFLLTNDRAGTGQAVEVAIDNVAYHQPTPALVVSSPGVAPGAPIDLGSDSATVNLANTGTFPLEITSLQIDGSGATLATTVPDDFLILPGTSVNVVVDLTSAAADLSADLSFSTNDPNNSYVQLRLIASSSEPTTLSDVTGAGVYGATGSVSATLTSGGSPLAGQLVTFSFEISGVTTNLGSATTNSSGVATLPSVSLTSINAGTYQNSIDVIFAATTGYAATTGSGNLAVAKATLTVSAVNQDMPHAGTLPTLTDRITGFVPGDNLSSVSGTVVLSTTASSTSPAGIYPISVNVSALSALNYTFTLQPGNLTVHPTVTNVLVQWGSRSMSIVGLNRDLPFTNITAIDILFSDNVTVTKSDLALTGVNSKNYTFSGFSYNSITDEATWTIPSALSIDHLMLTLDGTSPTGVHIASPTIPLLSNTTQSFAVLPGDVNGDGIVNSQDSVLIRNQILGITPATIWDDIDGIGIVTLQDYLDVQKRLGTHL